jgi:hypothetical protein
MFVSPLQDMIRILQNNNAPECITYINTHILTLIETLTVGSQLDAFSNVVQPLQHLVMRNAQTAYISSTLRTKIRRAFSLFQRGRLTLKIREFMSSLNNSQHTNDRIVHVLGQLFYSTFCAILLLTYPSLREVPQLTTIDNQKSFAIIFMGAFFESGYLCDDFSWSRFRE